jgi:hypothetical protein
MSLIQKNCPNTETGADEPERDEVLPPSPAAQAQLSLFQTFYAPEATRERQSNVIEIWDAAPKYVTPRRDADLTGKPPTVLEKTFDFRGTLFRVRVAPVVFKTARGENAIRLPTAREELIEDVLRHIAIQQHRGFVGTKKGDAIFGVRFSLDMLRRELARHGHGIKHADLVDSLMILSGCIVDIAYAHQRTALHRAAILSNLVGRSRDDYLNDRHTLWEAHFHPMVASSLSAIAYRQYDYETTLGYRSSLARWLHKQLALAYLNAGMTQPHKLLLSTIRANSGLLNSQTLRRQAQDVEDALKELKASACPVLQEFKRHPVYGQRRLLDVEYELRPTAEFVKQVVAANRRQKDGKLTSK